MNFVPPPFSHLSVTSALPPGFAPSPLTAATGIRTRTPFAIEELLRLSQKNAEKNEKPFSDRPLPISAYISPFFASSFVNGPKDAQSILSYANWRPHLLIPGTVDKTGGLDSCLGGNHLPSRNRRNKVSLFFTFCILVTCYTNCDLFQCKR